MESRTDGQQYRVEISTSNSFSTVIESATTDHTNWAPKMLNSAFHSGQPLYWRVAVVDEGNNVGGFAMAPLRAAKPLVAKARGRLRHGKRGTVEVAVTSRGRRTSGALVSL